MNTALAVKEVNFNGDPLKATRQNDKVYVGVSYICNGIGLTKSQKDTQIQKIQIDEVLNKGCLKFQAGVFDPNNETLGLDIEFLPLWLAKIHVTPTMKRNQPELTQKLITYQLEAKEVLAKAFLHRSESEYTQILRTLANNQKLLIKKVNTLESAKNNVVLFPIKADIDPYEMYNRLYETLDDVGHYIENPLLICNNRAYKGFVNACVQFLSHKLGMRIGDIWGKLYDAFDPRPTLTETAMSHAERSKVIDRLVDMLEAL